MATSKSQRIGIAIILAVTVIDVRFFYVMVLAQDNQTKEAAKQQSALADYQAKYAEYQNKVEAQDAELSSKYYDKFKAITHHVVEFNLKKNNKELKFEDFHWSVRAKRSRTKQNLLPTTLAGTLVVKYLTNLLMKVNWKSPLPIADGLKNASSIEGRKEQKFVYFIKGRLSYYF